MERKYKIAILKPCHENWDEMTPTENGRFCLNCSKTVVDFTTMPSDEIQHFFIQNQNNRICGRFRKTQLDTITIEIPNHILYKQKSYHKMFLLSLFVTMGTTLFSCADKNGNKTKIDKVEVVADTSKAMPIVVGEAPMVKNSSDHVASPPPPKIDHVKFVKPVTISCGEAINDKKQSSKQVKEDDSPFVGAVMQKNAEFPGGIDPFYTYFGNEFKTPENTYTKNLKIRISFAVEKNGSLSYIQSEPAIDKAIETEIIRVLSLSPKWQPGESNGKKIKMQYSLPIVLQ
nr:hypothetical protein [uncultured Flavobacterium sp.]